MLMHHADAGFNGVFWRVKLNRLPFEQKFSLCRLQDPVEHVHQRGLACAVFPNDCPNFAFLNAQVNVVICSKDTKPLCQVSGFNDSAHGCFRLSYRNAAATCFTRVAAVMSCLQTETDSLITPDGQP